VWVADGALVIRSNATWDGSRWVNLTSGAVQSRSKKAWKGRTRVCVSAKLPGGPDGNGSGIWPAHWMMPDDDSCWPCHGELDIMEMVNGDGQLHGTYHWCTNQTCNQNEHQSGQVPMADDWWHAWHEYAIEYDGSTQVAFAVDGDVYKRVSLSSRALFWSTPFYLILNTAIGDGTTWPRATDAHTVFPAYHLVDYVRVSQPTADDGCSSYLDCCPYSNPILCDPSTYCKCEEGGACFTKSCGMDGCCRSW